MIQVYADELLAYDSRLEDYSLLQLTITNGINKGGAATIVMPPGHPAYTYFTSYKTIVTVYRDGVLLFRGRALYPEDDLYRRRTIVCEGELCFFRDSVARPYIYQDGPAAVFTNVVELHNAQVEAAKAFKVGAITVTDANNYIRVESEAATQTSDVLDKLLERCGGYFIFTTDTEGQRTINWLAELPYRSNQVIEFGENLLDFLRSDANTDLATVIIPYGAQDEETGERLTIESVNEGLDFIQDYDAVALRGVIAKPVFWDDITLPENLLAKAQAYLASSRNMVTSLQLDAVDLYNLDRSIDAFRVGDTVRVRSKPHGVDEDFQITERTEDLLNPEGATITLGKEKSTLTGSDVAGDKAAQSELHRVEHNIRAEYQLNIAAAIQEAKTTLTSLIQQTSDAIRLEVSEQYATNDAVTSIVSTSMTQLSDSFNFLFESLQAVVDENDAEAREQFETITRYIRFEDGNIILGEVGNELTLRIQNDRISFLDGGAEVAYISNKQLYILDGHFLHSLRVGQFAWLPRENGNLSLVKAGE